MQDIPDAFLKAFEADPKFGILNEGIKQYTGEDQKEFWAKIERITAQILDKVEEIDAEGLELDLGEIADQEEPDEDDSGGDSLIWNLQDSEALNRKKYQYIEHGNKVEQRFLTTTAFTNLVFSDTDPKDIVDSRRLSKRDTHSTSTLNVSWEQCHELAIHGWPEGIEAIKKFKDRLHSVLLGQVKLPVISYDVTGDQLDVARWVNGEPEDFMTQMDGDKDRDSQKPTMIHIVATIDITSSPKSAIMRGAAIAALTQILEQHGYRVQIDLHCGSNGFIDTWVRAKEYDASVYIESLVFFLAHPVVFHRMVMGAWEHLPRAVLVRAGELGTSSWGWISEPAPADRGTVYVSALGSRWIAREETTVEWIKGQLLEAGIKLVEK